MVAREGERVYVSERKRGEEREGIWRVTEGKLTVFRRKGVYVKNEDSFERSPLSHPFPALLLIDYVTVITERYA
jgi:hypothetical protein